MTKSGGILSGKVLHMRQGKDDGKQRQPCQQQDEEVDTPESPEGEGGNAGRLKAHSRVHAVPALRKGKKSRRVMERVGGPIESLARDLGLWGGVKLHRIRVAWSALFDSASSRFSQHIEPVSLEFGRLVVNVESGLWLSKIHYYKNEMLRKLEPFGVKAVILRVGDVPERKKPAGKRRLKTGPLKDEDAQLIESLTKCLPDAELKLAAGKAIARSMGYDSRVIKDGEASDD
jgi:hypothetical protein